MILHLETVTETMQNLARGVFEHFDKEYYLAGGTALALHIGHRKSVDLDYFIAKPIDTVALKKNIYETFASSVVEILFEEKDTLWSRIDGVNMSFISRFDALVEPVQTVDFFRLAGIKDIAMMKLIAVCGREEYKDYFDLACIADETDIRSWVPWWQKIYPDQDVTSWVVALSAVDMVLKIPLEISDGFKEKNVSGNVKKVVRAATEYIQRA